MYVFLISLISLFVILLQCFQISVYDSRFMQLVSHEQRQLSLLIDLMPKQKITVRLLMLPFLDLVELTLHYVRHDQADHSSHEPTCQDHL